MTVETDIKTEHVDDLNRTQLWLLVSDEWCLIADYEDHAEAEDALQSLVQFCHEHGCTKEVRPSLKFRRPNTIGPNPD